MFKKIALCLTFCLLIAQARVVLDSDNKEVQIPDKAERIMPITGVFVQIALALGNEDKIISGAYRGLSPLMLKIFPKLKTTGFQGGSLSASVETIIASNTQVVFGPSSTLFDENIRKQLQSAGVVVVRMDSPAKVKDLQDRITKIAAIFGGQSVQKAKEINAYFDEVIAFVQGRLPKNAPKKSVLILRHNAGNWVTTINNYVAAEYIRVVGAENPSTQAGSPGLSPILNEEQIIIYNPDIILTNSNETRTQILKNTAFKQLKAVKNSQVFVQPRGAAVYLWTGTEGALQVLWLATILHPNEFKDIDIRAKVREFYEKFYRYKLSESELDEIFYPKDMRLLY